MATLTVRMFSKALMRQVSFDMFIPGDREAHDDKPMKTLFLLHGYTGSGDIWLPLHLAEKYNVAVVAPCGENSFWLDREATGQKYCTYVGQELVAYIRKTFHLAMEVADTGIMGLSMGGYGALHVGLAHPESFGKIGAMSSALIVHGIAGMKPGSDNGIANYAYYAECFGDLEKVEQTIANPEVQVDKLLAKGESLPDMYICCGTEDHLVESNRVFHAFLEKRGVPHEYHEGPGVHDMAYWHQSSEKIIPWMFGE